jgi:hypothetical protein
MIDGDFFVSLADIKIYEEIPHDKNFVTLYSDTVHYQKAIRIICNHPDTKFKLITHNGDESVINGLIPENLIAWYAQNLEFKHPKIFPLPIGLENNHWHPHKRSILKKAAHNKSLENRKIKALSQFNPNTYTQERYNLIEMVANERVFADNYYCLNGTNFEQYVDNLMSYAFCLCPRGNGIDTHRMWEAITLGCIPIVKRYYTHSFEEKFPIVFVDDWSEVTEDFLKKTYDKIDNALFDTPILRKEYWKQRILHENN